MRRTRPGYATSPSVRPVYRQRTRSVTIPKSDQKAKFRIWSDFAIMVALVKKNLWVSSVWALALFSFFAVQERIGWPLLRYAGIRSFSFFTDLGWVFKSADSAKIIGWEIYNPQPPKDYSPYLYGSNLIRVVDFLGINESHTKIAGWTLMFLFCALLGMMISLIKIRSITFSFFVFLILISPPNQLLLERANFDLFIIILLVVVTITVYTNKFLLSVFIVVFISLLKYYTLPMLIWFLIIWSKFKLRITTFIVFILAAIYIFLDIKKIQIDFPRPSWAAFGNPIFGVYFNRFDIDLPPRVQDSIGLALLGVTLLILKYIVFRFKVNLPTTKILTRPENFIDSIFATFLIVFLICYFSSTSFDYRLVYLMVPIFIYINGIHNDYKVKNTFYLATFLSFWLSYNSGDFQLLGDLAILFWVGIFIRSILLEIRERKALENDVVRKVLAFIL